MYFVPVRLGLATSVIGLWLIPAILFSHFQWRLNYFFVCLWHKLAYGVCVSVCIHVLCTLRKRYYGLPVVGAWGKAEGVAACESHNNHRVKLKKKLE